MYVCMYLCKCMCAEDTYNQQQVTSNQQRSNSEWNSGHISSFNFMRMLARNQKVKIFAASLFAQWTKDIASITERELIAFLFQNIKC